MFGGSVVPEEVAEQASATMSGGNSADSRLLASWFAKFFLLHQQELQTSQHRQAQ
jgi:hypothetical protein